MTWVMPLEAETNLTMSYSADVRKSEHSQSWKVELLEEAGLRALAGPVRSEIFVICLWLVAFPSCPQDSFEEPLCLKIRPVACHP